MSYPCTWPTKPQKSKLIWKFDILNRSFRGINSFMGVRPNWLRLFNFLLKMLKTFDNGICIGGLNVAGVAMFLFATIASTLSAFPLLLSWLGL